MFSQIINRTNFSARDPFGYFADSILQIKTDFTYIYLNF